MKKKVDVRDLKIGMYVSELDRPWIDSPFLFQGFELKDDEDLENVRKHCAYVFIDIERGLDFVPQAAGAGAVNRAQALEAWDKKIVREFRQLAEAPVNIKASAAKPYQDKTTFELEIVEARQIESDARDIMRTAVEDVQQGKKLNVELAEKVIGKMVDSTVRNPDALVCLSQLKETSEYAALHSIRTCVLALAFGRHLVFGKEDLISLGLGAMFHDIGMAKVPQEILDKPGKLTVDEFAVMEKHVEQGKALVEASGNLPVGAIQMVMQHHERADGTGYPNHLQGEQISFSGNIGAIIDVYDAITSDNSYKKAISAEMALKKIFEWRTKDFNQELVESFISCMGIFPIGSLVELSTGDIGVVVTINRSRRLKPKIALVLTAKHRPYREKVFTDLQKDKAINGKEIKIKKVLPTGALGINPMDHILQI
ncbi:MAG: HD-GYP domain-containing protein [Gammaproteobacteria bacterium]|nr:MAG: HD-GYP domain-containing protein [Gammaproteobacteria bacterium]